MKKILWEKFKDPYKEEIDKDLDDDEDDEDSLKESSTKALVSDMGILPLTNETLLSEKYNLWMVYVNFDLTTDLVDMIEEVPGVETLDIYSRYRMRVGFGKLFDENNCKLIIDHILGIMSDSLEALDEETKNSVNSQVETFKESKVKNWAIYVFPSGKAVTYADENKDNFLPKLKLFEEVKNMVGGQLVTSESS